MLLCTLSFFMSDGLCAAISFMLFLSSVAWWSLQFCKEFGSMNAFINQTLSEIVIKQNSAVPVLEKYNFYYCCKGKRSLQKACEENDLDVTIVLNELQNIPSSKKSSTNAFYWNEGWTINQPYTYSSNNKMYNKIETA